jgi:hypothetical protein
MPIHLAPISRRRFLAQSLAATAAYALGHSLRGAEAAKPTDENSFALLSDPHLAADKAHIARGVNMADHFTAVTRELVALEKRPAGVFINGDCAYNSGETADYGTVVELLKPIREAQMPVHLALGNHDNRERFWDALTFEKSAPRPLADRQAAVLQTPMANWFILDSLEKTLSTPGLLGSAQLGWLGKELDANPHKPALVMVHHNPGIDGNLGLKDTLALFETIRPRKQVKAYIYGHTHTWKIEKDDTGIHLVNLPPVAYLFREGDPPGWVHASLQNDGMRLELRCIDPNHKSQGQVVELHWRT